MDSAFGQFMHSVFGGFDMSVFSAFGSISNPVLNQIAVIFSAICSEYFLLLLALFGVALCFFKRYRKWGYILVLCVLAAFVAGKLILNPLCARIRPYNALQSSAEYFTWYINAGKIPESKYSFPSCHSMAAFCLALSIFYMQKNHKIWKALVLFVVATLIACSRTYLMVHYPTDVIAGVLLGLILGVPLALLSIWLDKNLAKLPVIKVFDRLDIEKAYRAKHPKPKNTFVMGKHYKATQASGNSNFSTTAKRAFIGAILAICIISIAIQEVGINGLFKRCDYQGNDYICMNKGSNSVTDANGEVHHYCDLHKQGK